VEHVHDSLATRPIQQIVQRYECPRAANPRAAVDDVRASQRCGAGGVVAAEFPVESEQGSRLHGNAVVRPGGEVQLTNCCRQTVLATIAATTSCMARGWANWAVAHGPPQLRGLNENSKKLLPKGNIKILFETDNLELKKIACRS